MFIRFRPESRKKRDIEASQVRKERVARRQEWLDVMDSHCICAFDHSMGLSVGISIQAYRLSTDITGN